MGDRKGVTLVYLQGDEGLIADRINQHQHRYMLPPLLRSQFEALEEPGAGEPAIVALANGTLVKTVTELLRKVAAVRASRAVVNK